MGEILPPGTMEGHDADPTDPRHPRARSRAV